MMVNQGDVASHCGLYVPGHDVHWIQAKLSARSETDLPVPGHLLEARPDGLMFVEVDGGIRRLWNHNPERLKRMAARGNGQISYQPRFHLLLVRGTYLFCVVDADSSERQPCPERPPTGDPIQLLKEAGGFSIPGPEAIRWIDSQED